MIILLTLLIVLFLFGLGLAVHFLFFVATLFLVVWLAGFAIGRGESAGRHHFYRWEMWLMSELGSGSRYGRGEKVFDSDVQILKVISIDGMVHAD